MSRLLLLKKLSYLTIVVWASVRLGGVLRDLGRRQRVKAKRGDLLLLMGLMLLFTRIWGVELFRVTSSSMEPTLNPGEVFVAVKRPLWREPVQAGDIVVLHRDGARVSDLVKRVVAVAGDRLCITQQGVEVNGKPLARHGALAPKGDRAPIAPVTVPVDSVFVLGDNSPYSVDSRSFGPVLETQVYGRAQFRVYPFRRWGRL